CIFRRKAPSGNGGKRPGRTVKAPSRFGEFAHP
ncbi:phosphoglycerate mutase, partial [Azospirillum palustre]